MTFSKVPINLNIISDRVSDSEILRTGIAAEIDAINLYEQMSFMASSTDISTLLLDIANEEKTHIGEFVALLLNFDEKQAEELVEGREEVEEMGIEVLHPILVKK